MTGHTVEIHRRSGLQVRSMHTKSNFTHINFLNRIQSLKWQRLYPILSRQHSSAPKQRQRHGQKVYLSYGGCCQRGSREVIKAWNEVTFKKTLIYTNQDCLWMHICQSEIITISLGVKLELLIFTCCQPN